MDQIAPASGTGLPLSAFEPNQKVRYIGFRDQYKGKTGVVRRVVKSRKVVTIGWDGIDPKSSLHLYDANPESLEILPKDATVV